MHEDTPPEASSKARNNGPSSSQLARRRAPELLLEALEKSGARKGFASCRDLTDCGTTRRSLTTVGAAS